MKAHLCHVPGCGKNVVKSLLMCSDHWKRVPEPLRMEVLTHYQKGQEKGKIKPSTQYLRAARAAIASVCDTYVASIPLLDQMAEKEAIQKADKNPKWDTSRFKRRLDPE